MITFPYFRDQEIVLLKWSPPPVLKQTVRSLPAKEMAEAQLLTGLAILLLTSLVAAKTQQVSTLVPDRLLDWCCRLLVEAL